MSVETSTSTSSSGTTTTVGATVRDTAGPGLPRKIDVYLLIEPSKLKHVTPGSPVPKPTAHDKDRLAVYWKGLTLSGYGELKFTYKLKRKPGDAYEGAVEGTLIVCDRDDDVIYVKRFSLCPLFRGKLDLPIHSTKKSSRTSRGRSRAR